MRSSAARYARALLDVAIAEANPEQAEQELTAFVELLGSHAELQKALTNPAVPVAGKRAVLQQILDRLAPSSPVRKLLLMLAEGDRLALLPDLLDVYRERLMVHMKVVKAEVTTAEALSDDQVAQMRERIATATGRTVAMTTKVDPSIIGGVVTQIGSTVYDGRVATQIATIRQRLAEQV